ncbi:Prolyl oligopeptidase family protein isoform 3 [Capsicum annuum]|nr:Prolyl oligopeptidase family protein isoform 3 [Capsicum annuum]
MHGTTQIRSQESPKKRMVLGVFDASNYVTERQWATASDGTQIPISIIYHENLVKLDSSDPLLLYGYGSYEVCIDPTFKASRLSLLDRGFIYAIAHIRGEYLIDKYCCKEKLCINGRSAGGLLIGAVVNMRPDLFKAAVAGVPFVDFVTTMLDSTIPLTTSEWEEWGDPRKEEFYYYMKSYSPVDNVSNISISEKSQSTELSILVTVGLNGGRCQRIESSKEPSFLLSEDYILKRKSFLKSCLVGSFVKWIGSPEAFKNLAAE